MAPSTQNTARIHRDEPHLVTIEGWGRVKATSKVLAMLRKPLAPSGGGNRTVEACRVQAQTTALPFGPAQVEAVSRGAERPSRNGSYEGLVELRIVYTRRGYREVRQGLLRCWSDEKGQFINAKPIYPA